MVNRLFCFGLGFSALTLARRLLAQGWSVAGTCRTPDKARRLKHEGIDAHLFDGEQAMADAAAALAGTTHLIASVPPSDRSDPVARLHGPDIAGLPGLDWVGYLSTTGVYGDHGGGWVDESTPRTPSGERGVRRVAAEDDWLALHRDHGVPVHLFRLAGIYGPGRNALVSLKGGRARRIDKPGQVFSRIHVDDIAAVLDASMARPDPGTAYNVCDDDPAPPADVVAYAADLLGLAPPPLVAFKAADLSPMARSFYADNKRVRNDRIKTELGVTLAYPSYRQGLTALLADETA